MALGLMMMIRFTKNNDYTHVRSTYAWRHVVLWGSSTRIKGNGKRDRSPELIHKCYFCTCCMQLKSVLLLLLLLLAVISFSFSFSSLSIYTHKFLPSATHFLLPFLLPLSAAARQSQCQSKWRKASKLQCCCMVSL